MRARHARRCTAAHAGPRTPCPFRIQVTQNDGRSTVLLDDLGAHAAKSALHNNASSGDEVDTHSGPLGGGHDRGSAAGTRGGSTAVHPAAADVALGSFQGGGHAGRDGAAGWERRPPKRGGIR